MYPRTAYLRIIEEVRVRGMTKYPSISSWGILTTVPVSSYMQTDAGTRSPLAV
jgi:hypothetical protein